MSPRLATQNARMGPKFRPLLGMLHEREASIRVV